jgi:hypothetical protein
VSSKTQIRDELTTGIEAENRVNDPRPHYEVAWIRWDSGFRGTGLRVGDHIIAVGDEPIVRPKTTEEAQKTIYKSIGQYAEHQRWQELGLRDGAPLTLTIERPSPTGVGWERATIQGQIRANRVYFDENDNETLGPDGPRTNHYGDPDGQWRDWYEKQIVKPVSIALRIWWLTSSNSRYELSSLLAQQDRVNKVIQRYPGPFASALQSDFQDAIACLKGRAYTLTEEDLRYRKSEDEKVKHIADLARRAFSDFKQEHAADILPELPTVHPVRDDRSAVTGKLVLLPPLGNRDWYGEMDRYFFGARNNDKWFFVEVYGDAATRMREAAYRYARLVQPNIQMKYTILGRILPDPRLVYTAGGSQVGLSIEPVAALVGDEAMFVDLTQKKGNLSLFAGEEELMRPSAPATGPESTPKEVMEACVCAIKDGDEASWKGCYADWSAVLLDDGRVRIYPWSRSNSRGWEDARRRVLKDVYGAPVVWVGEPRDLTRGDEFEGAPRLQEVEVWLDHIGLFDGEHRAFTSPFLHRQRILQRLNDGPWRITDDHAF